MGFTSCVAPENRFVHPLASLLESARELWTAPSETLQFQPASRSEIGALSAMNLQKAGSVSTSLSGMMLSIVTTSLVGWFCSLLHNPVPAFPLLLFCGRRMG